MNQRIIKFRAWWKTGREMKDWIETRKHSLNKMSEMSWELMQFTGLLDCKGKEIYEGDIIMSRNPKKSGIVVFGEHSNSLGKYSGWFIKRILKIGNPKNESIIDFNVSEVIGNIYENPELLK